MLHSKNKIFMHLKHCSNFVIQGRKDLVEVAAKSVFIFEQKLSNFVFNVEDCLNPKQFGFQWRKRKIPALIDYLKTTHKNKNDTSFAGYLDYKKGFDQVLFVILLSKFGSS